MSRTLAPTSLPRLPRTVLFGVLATAASLAWACGGGDEDTAASGAGGSSAGAAGSGVAGSGVGGSSAAGTAGSGTAGSGTAGSGTAGSGTAGSGTAGSGTAGSGAAGSGTAGSGAAGSGGSSGGKVVSAKASPIDGWFQTNMPLDAPMHLYVSAIDAAGKPTSWPAGTTFTATGGDCVYAKAYGPRILLFAKASCPETVSITATTPDGPVSTTATIKTFAQPSPKLVDAWLVPGDVPTPVYLPDFAAEKGLGLHVGAKGTAYLRARFAASGNLPEYSCILTPEELGALKVTAPLTDAGQGTFVGSAAGTGQATATWTLPKPGMPDAPYVLEATFSVTVHDDLPIASVWIKPDNDTAGTSQLSVNMGAPCRRYHLIARHADATSSYYVEHPWSDATLTWGSQAYATMSDQGDYCPVAPGQTEVEIAFGGKTQKLGAEVRPPEGQSFTVRIDPDPVEIASVGDAGCVELHVFAKVPGGAEEDVTANPTVKPYAVPKPDPKALPPLWAFCGRQPDGKLTCCSNGTSVLGQDGKSHPPSEAPGLVSVYYAGGGGSVPLTSK